MKVYAHRAGNDLAKIHMLKKAGFCTVEGDVMFARDKPIMVHPAGLPNRLADGNLDYTSEEVVQMLAGQGIAVPTLAEMLELIQEVKMHLLLEVKIPGTMERISHLFSGTGRPVGVISFFGSELVCAYRLGLSTGALMAHAPTKLVGRTMLEEYGPFMFLMDQWYVDSATIHMLHHAYNTPVQVVAYTVNDLERARLMDAMGVDAILSDKPLELVDQAKGGWLQPG